MSIILDSREIRKIIHPNVPTDIINLISDYIHPIITPKAGILYDGVVKFLGPKPVSKNIFVDKMVALCIQKLGSSFKEFLEKYQKLIIEKRGDTVHCFINHFINSSGFTYVGQGSVDWPEDEPYPYFHDFLYDVLKMLAIKEGYIKNDGSLYTYIEKFCEDFYTNDIDFQSFMDNYHLRDDLIVDNDYEYDEPYFSPEDLPGEWWDSSVEGYFNIDNFI